MANKMLVDATHPEETRVVVLRGNRVQEFDFESANRRQLRGNIYLAKVTRVEPSLQAAFVDYGGNRHGFLAFSEIHPDYYQIPVADRQALIEAERREDDDAENGNGNGEPDTVAAAAAEAESVSEPAGAAADDAVEPDDRSDADGEMPDAPVAEASPDEEDRDGDGDGEDVVSDEQVDSVGAEDALEEVPVRRKARARQYKIQEVIKRRQVLLVQVVKEERGNKGAALTTYLSLAGRYSVLMPNTARGGGISRKITSPADRKRLKDVVADLDVAEGMGVILRTAGASRTKAEVKRDFEYLLRLWENVRELTLHSTAPTLVYEEGSLIKRSIRDLYSKEIDEILVAGEDAYREAKEFMRMLMPSHAKNVKPYRDSQPLFARAGIEAQLDAMFSPQVTLKSGGYLVINQTEALVSIDVNSGRSTREHNIEDTALQTNLEAAEEVARQLRLRDLAGLIVIDFIDMEEKRNNRAVERRIKDALKSDRARIQVGRISHFGLLEMSRQRIRTGVLESTTSVCPTCQGSGHVRAPASVALHVLRSLEEQLLKGATHNLIIRTRTPVALYILNQKRAHLSDLEQRFGLTITVNADESLVNSAHFAVERGEPAERPEAVVTSVQPDSVQPDEDLDDLDEAAAEVEAAGDEEPREGESERRPRRRRRRRRGGGSDSAGETKAETVDADPETDTVAAQEEEPDERTAGGDEDGDAPAPKKRRRGRRGGRRGQRGRGNGERGNGEHDETQVAGPEAAPEAPADDARPSEPPADGDAPPADPETAPVINGDAGAGHVPAAAPSEPEETDAAPIAFDTELPSPVAAPEPEPAAEDEWTPQDSAAPEAEEPVVASEAEEPELPRPEVEETAEEDSNRPKRSGWWQRRSFF
ncbi:MAG: Rne/Rng family ribonuclease [Bauldia sp.]|uniref:ribonuclease E/G n=1 Tax=Bauldia sp. TaxID=2575872 RepID=UPI001DA3528D|nr:ribonuclease E/G [Bauldia sp.]MCB1496170.1 Rne/Rng family ribonuclease [Bauldia sp.]